MAELIQETKNYMSAIGYSKDDIQWIGGRDFIIPIDCFWNASPQVYDAGFGWQEVACDLVIVFKDGTWLDRREYDGSEWWEHQSCPEKPSEIRYINNFISYHYERTLMEINRKNED